MRIGIDGRWIQKELSGIPAYTVELVRQLAVLDHENEYVIFFCDRALALRTSEQAGSGALPNFSTAILDYSVFSMKNQLRFSRILSRYGLDVFHSPNYMISFPAFPRNRRGKTGCVVNIHDMIPMVFPDHAPKSKKSRFFPVYKRIMLESGARADRIITASQSAKNDIVAYLGVSPEKVVVIPDGVDSRFTPLYCVKPDANSVKTILWVGRLDPYKNVEVLIDAFVELLKKSSVPVELRLAGPPDDRYPEGRAKTERLGLTGNVKWLGYLSDEKLLDEYRCADVFALPSRYEGFGLTVLEAMACGTPVICSNVSSLPEVAGSAAVLVDPDDTEGIADAMLRVLGDDQFAGELRVKGLERAALFTWEHTARATIDVYKDVFE